MKLELDAALDEVKSHYHELLSSKRRRLTNLRDIDIPKEVGVYVIYKGEKPLYVGETQELDWRLYRLWLVGSDHTLASRLLRQKTGLKLKQLKERWNDEAIRKAREELRADFLEKCDFQYIVIKGKKKRGRAKLLERLAILMLDPMYKDYEEP